MSAYDVTYYPTGHLIPGRTEVTLPDGMLRVFKRGGADSDDASRTYELDVLGVTVQIRWQYDAEYGKHRLVVQTDPDCDSEALFHGVLCTAYGAEFDEHTELAPR